MSRSISRRLAVVILAISCCGNSTGAFAADIDPADAQASASVQARQKAEALYQALILLETRYAGMPGYDYLLGIAALDTNRLETARSALQRVVAAQPGNSPARLELARTYFLLGQRDDAKREFEIAQAANPPANVRPTIQAYLNAIDSPVGARTQWHGYVQSSLGHDTNVNAATSRDTIAIPAFAGLSFLLNDDARSRSDNFGTVSGGVGVRHSLRPGLILSAGLDADLRSYNDLTQFNQSNYTAQVGLNRIDGPNNLGLQLQNQRIRLNDDSYRSLNGVNAQWTRDLSPALQAAVFGQYATMHYFGQSLRDVDRAVFGGSLVKGFDVSGQPVLFGTAYLGRESPDETSAAVVGNRLYGFSFGANWHMTPQQFIFAKVGYERRRYDQADPLFMVERTDRQTDIQVGYTYAFTKAFSVTPQIGNVHNRSNIELNDYRRTVYEVVARYEFR